jgi:pentatricopeptide repeat protein
MLEDRVKPDEFTMSSVLSTYAQLGSLEQGKFINQKHIQKNAFVLKGLVDIYSKCGDLAYARQIFDNMQRRNTECWNSMITALARHGQSDEAISCFLRWSARSRSLMGSHF